MSTPLHIAVIGAGVAGVSAAARASELGARVTVLERSHVAAGSSGLSAGSYSINQTDPLMTELRVRAREVIDRLETVCGMHVGRIGYVRLGKTDRHMRMYEETIEIQRELGAEPSIVLDAAGLNRLVPDLNTDDLVGGLFNPRDGHIDGPLACGALKDLAEADGAAVRVRSEVTGVAAGINGKRYRLHTTRGPVDADVVVNAAGPWAMQVGEMLGMPLPLINQRHEMMQIKLGHPLAYTMPMVQEYVPGEGEGVNFRQDAPGMLLGNLHSNEILGHLESEDPDRYARTIEMEKIERFAIRVTQRIPLDDLGFAAGWTGLYPVSADGRYVVGPYEAEPTIIACGGFGGSGLASGLALGRVAAEWAIWGRQTTLKDATDFLPDRSSLQRPKPSTVESAGVATV